MEKDEKKETIAIDIKSLNIYEKLSYISNELKTVAKNLKVQVGQGSSYQAVGEKDVLNAVKPLEFKYRVYSYPVTRSIIDSGIYEQSYSGDKVKKQLYERIETTYRFVNLDNTSEFIDIKSYGDGIDSGDKSVGKAMTYADKYALLKAYKIETGEDPDQEASGELGSFKKSEDTASPAQINLIRSLGVNIPNVLRRFGIDKIEALTKSQASFIIKSKKEETSGD